MFAISTALPLQRLQQWRLDIIIAIRSFVIILHLVTATACRRLLHVEEGKGMTL